MKRGKIKKNKGKIFFIIIFLVIVISVLLCVKYIDFGNFPLDMRLNGENEITINLGESYVEQGANAKFLFMDVSDKIKSNNNINIEKPGSYQVNYSYKNKLTGKNLERKVVVVDNIAPTLTLEKEKIKIYTDGVLHLGKIKAKDNIDGNISDKVEIDELSTKKAGKYKLKVSVKDSSGNETSKNIDVTIKEKPIKNGSNNARIDVYISEQKLYYFENNKLMFTSDVVTGKKDKTPRGNYKILKKKKDVYLKGDTFLDHVDYWMAFIGGLYGIHDASWRNEFGGDIFLKDGSHGCVNMPVKNMKKLYEMAGVGTAVNIYD